MSTDARSAMAGISPTPDLRLYHVFPASRAPRRARADALGTLPTRAFRYCEAVRIASMFGTYLFPPVDLVLQWDGQRVFASWGDGSPTMVIDDTLNFPNYPDQWTAMAPDDAKSMCVPHVIAFPEPGMLQYNLGVMVKTAPGWGVMIRGPANFPINEPIEIMEGFVDTDRWSGSIFVAMRITKTDQPVVFHKNRPIAQIQPMPHWLVGDAVSDDMTIEAEHPSQWSEEVWAMWRETLSPAGNDRRLPGDYARVARKAHAEADRVVGACPMGRGRRVVEVS
jgi:hypothetical protein